MIQFGKCFLRPDAYRLFFSLGKVDRSKLVEGEMIPYPFAFEASIIWPAVKIKTWKEQKGHWISSWRGWARFWAISLAPLGHVSICYRGAWKAPFSLGWYGRTFRPLSFEYAAPRIMPAVKLVPQERLRALVKQNHGF